MRQVVGFLDLLASNDPDRLVWVTAASVQSRCKNYDVKEKGKPTIYSLKMVEKCLQALRETGVLSRQHAIELQERRVFVVDHAFVVTPHDALCIPSKTCCRFVGMGKVHGTRWAADGKGDVWFVSNKEVFPWKVMFEAGPRGQRKLIFPELSGPPLKKEEKS
jgi:hypothetical protein